MWTRTIRTGERTVCGRRCTTGDGLDNPLSMGRLNHRTTCTTCTTQSPLGGRPIRIPRTPHDTGLWSEVVVRVVHESRRRMQRQLSARTGWRGSWCAGPGPTGPTEPGDLDPSGFSHRRCGRIQTSDSSDVPLPPDCRASGLRFSPLARAPGKCPVETGVPDANQGPKRSDYAVLGDGLCPGIRENLGR